MATELPDPETFGEPRSRHREKADTENYHSLFDFEESETES